MASHTAGTVLFGFAAVFCCIELLEAATKIKASQSPFAWFMAIAFVLAILTAFWLTLVLLFSYVRSLGANAAGERFLQRLAKATLLAAAAALLAGAVVQLVASGYLGAVVWVLTKR